MKTMKRSKESRILSEINHGKKLAYHGAEDIWGWGSSAGKERADRRARIIADSAGLGPGKRALEIGCGTGLFTEVFAATGAMVVAVDLSAELLDIARKRNLHPDRVQFIQKPFEDCSEKEPFDAIIGSSVLHHLDLSIALPKIFLLLKPGGIVSFAEPNMINPQILLQKNIPWLQQYLGDSPDETAFVRWRTRRLILQHGFIDVHVTPFDWLHPATPDIMIKSVNFIGKIFEKIPLIKEFAGSIHIKCRRPI
jgi:2-polyprenyl-3-methyl-5-hydroxy-6-metoxy-1,4-benzoquinol methylase